MDAQELTKLGRRVIGSGQLEALRGRLLLSRSAVAELIGVSPESLARWESGEQNMRDSSALLVGGWWYEAQKELEKNPDISRLYPVSYVISWWGVSYHTVMNWCRDGHLRHEHLGVLGYFVYDTEVRS